MTVDFISKNNKSVKYKRDESTSQYIKRITHVYMSEKNIEKVVSFFLVKLLNFSNHNIYFLNKY